MALKGIQTSAVPVVHPASEAVAPLRAFFAAAFPCPAAVTERLEAVVPYLPETVFADIALREPVPVDVRTGTDAAVDEHRSDVHAGVAEEAAVADLLFVAADIAFAAERYVHRSSFSPLLPYEFHQGPELCVRQFHIRIAGSAPDGDDSKQPPLLQASGLEEVVHPGEFADVPFVDAGHHVAIDARVTGKGIDGPQRA